MFYYEEIKSRLNMFDVITNYHERPNRAGFVRCPFHLEKTASMKISKDGYYCFGCHEHGNIFGFVMKMFSLDFRQACDKLNVDFNLNIPTSTYISKQDRIRMAEEKKKRDRERAFVAKMNEYRDAMLNYLKTAKLKMSYKLDELKDTLYSDNKFLCIMTEDLEFLNLCEEFVALKKKYDIIDFNITKFESVSEEELREIYSSTNGRVYIKI